MATVRLITGDTEIAKTVQQYQMTEQSNLANAVVLALAAYDAAYVGNWSVEQHVLEMLLQRKEKRCPPTS